MTVVVMIHDFFWVAQVIGSMMMSCFAISHTTKYSSQQTGTPVHRKKGCCIWEQFSLAMNFTTTNSAASVYTMLSVWLGQTEQQRENG